LEFLPILKSTKETVKLQTNDTGRLIYILRNAANSDKYRWLRSKFIFSLGTHIEADRIIPVVVCKIKQTTVTVVDGLRVHESDINLFDIVQYIIDNKPTAIRFTNAYLTDSEYERLEAYCRVNDYNLKKDETGVTIIHA
jgi:hypothetical protein